MCVVLTVIARSLKNMSYVYANMVTSGHRLTANPIALLIRNVPRTKHALINGAQILVQIYVHQTLNAE